MGCSNGRYLLRLPWIVLFGLIVTDANASFIASFQTTVSYINGPNSVSLAIGQTYQYEVLVDTGGIATLDRGTGTLQVFTDGVGTNGYYYDYFYADLVGIDDGLLDEPSAFVEWNRGFFREDPDRTRANDLTSLLIGDYLELNRFEISAPFQVGTTWSSHRRFTDLVYGDNFYNGSAVLTAIRNVNVGEPPPIALLALGIGLAGLGYMQRKQVKAA